MGETIQKSIANGSEMRRSLVEVSIIVSTTEAMTLRETYLTVLIVLESLRKGQDDSSAQLRRDFVRC